MQQSKLSRSSSRPTAPFSAGLSLGEFLELRLQASTGARSLTPFWKSASIVSEWFISNTNGAAVQNLLPSQLQQLATLFLAYRHQCAGLGSGVQGHHCNVTVRSPTQPRALSSPELSLPKCNGSPEEHYRLMETFSYCSGSIHPNGADIGNLPTSKPVFAGIHPDGGRAGPAHHLPAFACSHGNRRQAIFVGPQFLKRAHGPQAKRQILCGAASTPHLVTFPVGFYIATI
ncbi:hypothetical protein NA57DRAFT_55134 [Rhizodiscina lignyota]|uniref:Uncharacterized protein n=1 Tax=Rhizodiscina lignyota TaxID=1504668 RepID=A0A9P4IKT3_9PEZI|nr:hypothetical protein NA57DRAFT_55134 [Rhizodiscina lignyota]